MFETGVNVISLTFDGAPTNFTMCDHLNACIKNVNNMKTWFPHPCDRKINIFIFLDPPHMLKLVRNTLASYGSLLDPDNAEISWKYFELLVQAQNNEQLHLGNKLSNRHSLGKRKNAS